MDDKARVAYEYLYNTIYAPVFIDRLEKRGYHVQSDVDAQYLLALGHSILEQAPKEVTETLVKGASYVDHSEAAQAAAELSTVPSIRESVAVLLKAAGYGQRGE